MPATKQTSSSQPEPADFECIEYYDQPVTNDISKVSVVSSSKKSSTKLSTIDIIGIVIALVITIMLLIIAAFFMRT